jgi:Pvc16 N-terminal domain
MLFKSLEFLKEQLNGYLDSFPSDDPPGVQRPIAKLENIAGLDEAALKEADNILLTLVNISEEAALKNTPYYVKDFPNTIYRNPPVYLNLFILFTACLKKYDHALVLLSRVVRFFQGKSNFNSKNSVTQVKDFEKFTIIMDLYSPSFEQSNYLWSTLGGKQHPFVLYKLRLVEMERESTEETRGIIKEITLNDGAGIIQ